MRMGRPICGSITPREGGGVTGSPSQHEHEQGDKVEYNKRETDESLPQSFFFKKKASRDSSFFTFLRPPYTYKISLKVERKELGSADGEVSSM